MKPEDYQIPPALVSEMKQKVLKHGVRVVVDAVAFALRELAGEGTAVKLYNDDSDALVMGYDDLRAAAANLNRDLF